MEGSETPIHSKCNILRFSTDLDAGMEVNNSRTEQPQVWNHFHPGDSPYYSNSQEPYRMTGSVSKNSSETKESHLYGQNICNKIQENQRHSLQTNSFKQQLPFRANYTNAFRMTDTLKSISLSSQNAVDEQRIADINELKYANNHLHNQLQRVSSEYESIVLKYKQAMGEIQYLSKQVHSLKTTAASSRQVIESQNTIERSPINRVNPSFFARPQSNFNVVNQHIEPHRAMSPLPIRYVNNTHRPVSPSNMPLLLNKLQNLQHSRSQQMQQISYLRSQLANDSNQMLQPLSNDEHQKIQYIQKQIHTVANNSRRLAEQLRSPIQSPPKTVESLERFRRLERTKALYESENEQLKIKLLLKDKKIQELEQRVTKIKIQRSPQSNREYYM